jgi:hypothetical protein
MDFDQYRGIEKLNRIKNKVTDYTIYSSGETLLEKVRSTCQELADYGWRDLLLSHGLDITAKDLKSELSKELDSINRAIEGFQDFAIEGKRGITPGVPSHSLLYHAFASPQVTSDINGNSLKRFPTPAQIEVVENYVYGISPPSIQELRVLAKGAPLAIVVFASEYRPAINTVHQKHADLCFSRTGLTRVGNAPSHYLSDARGYLPFVDDDDYAIRVLPCRFSVYIAAQFQGRKDDFGPLRFQEGADIYRDSEGIPKVFKLKSDAERTFWVPLHKLFSGSECIRGKDLKITLMARHVNEKLRKVHKALAAKGFDTGWHEPQISDKPFVFGDELAEFSNEPEDGFGLLVPIVHPNIIEEATYKGKFITYKVPENEPFRSSLNISPRPSGARSAPEYVHARHMLNSKGQIQDLNDEPDVANKVAKGGYEALHYIDYTAEGLIEAECSELTFDIPRSLSAYSVVAPVDYFPLVKQQDLMQWWNQSVPLELEDNIWPSNPGPPQTLCDIRYPANLSLTLKKLDIENNERTVFDANDETMTAIIGFANSGLGKLTKIDNPKNLRVSSLPDGAAGVFAPGWDISIDRTEETDPSDDGSILKPGTTYLNNYGLGSPFPEDAMLCAALSAYWPAASPDITRTFSPGRYAATTPLTDEIIGQTGQNAWDGIPGPKIPNPKMNEVEYMAIEYADYVQVALNKNFNFKLIAQTTAAEYCARTLTMARVYTSLGAITREQKIQWALFSFVKSNPVDTERIEAEKDTGIRLSPEFAYCFKIFRHQGVKPNPNNHKTRLVSFKEMLTIYADPQTVLRKNADGNWIAYRY